VLALLACVKIQGNVYDFLISCRNSSDRVLSSDGIIWRLLTPYLEGLKHHDLEAESEPSLVSRG
jgi:hypothetical protein